MTMAVNYNYVGGALLRDVYVITVGGVYNSGGGVKGAEERLVIKNGRGASTIHNDKLVITVGVQGVVRRWSVRWSPTRGTAACERFGFVRHHHAGEFKCGVAVLEDGSIGCELGSCELGS